MDNILDNALIKSVYDWLTLQTSTSNFVALFGVADYIKKQTELPDYEVCVSLALNVIGFLESAHLVVFDNGYKTLPVL